MSEEGDTFWVSLAERVFGLIFIIIGAIMLYFTATSTDVLGGFSAFFGALSLVLVIVGIFLLIVKPPE
jgi:uncharacterized protein YjeT (DUF2065 family)